MKLSTHRDVRAIDPVVTQALEDSYNNGEITLSEFCRLIGKYLVHPLEKYRG